MLTTSLTAISDEEMSDVDVKSNVVPKKPRVSYKEIPEDEDEFEDEDEVDTKVGIKPVNGATEDDEEGDDEDLDEDEYVVEKIFSHYIADDVRHLGLPSSCRFTGDSRLTGCAGPTSV